MPTTRRRHAITETNDVAEALAAAAKHWPEDSERRAVLLRRLIEEGRRSLRAANDNDHRARLRAIDRTAGSLTGSYGDRYLEELREDWPA